jgi:hypothetical protein
MMKIKTIRLRGSLRSQSARIWIALKLKLAHLRQKRIRATLPLRNSQRGQGVRTKRRGHGAAFPGHQLGSRRAA